MKCPLCGMDKKECAKRMLEFVKYFGAGYLDTAPEIYQGFLLKDEGN